MMGTAMRVGAITTTMEAFGLEHATRRPAGELEIAERDGLTHRELPSRPPDCEARGRSERKRNHAAAHFPPHVKAIDEFDPSGLGSGVTQGHVDSLKELTWLDSHGNVVLAGPPGLKKMMMALGLGLLAVDEGHTVAFGKMGSPVRVMDDADVDRKAGSRLRYLRECQLAIIDEIGYAPITKARANRLLGFVSDACGRSSLVFTTNKGMPDWAEMVGDPVLATAPMDGILHHARCFSLQGESYRLKHPEPYALRV